MKNRKMPLKRKLSKNETLIYKFLQQQKNFFTALEIDQRLKPINAKVGIINIQNISWSVIICNYLVTIGLIQSIDNKYGIA